MGAGQLGAARRRPLRLRRRRRVPLRRALPFRLGVRWPMRFHVRVAALHLVEHPAGKGWEVRSVVSSAEWALEGDELPCRYQKLLTDDVLEVHVMSAGVTSTEKSSLSPNTLAPTQYDSKHTITGKSHYDESTAADCKRYLPAGHIAGIDRPI